MTGNVNKKRTVISTKTKLNALEKLKACHFFKKHQIRNEGEDCKIVTVKT